MGRCQQSLNHNSRRKGADAAKLFAEFGAAVAHAKDGRHAMMHKTATVDYALVLEGEIVAVMDVGGAVMRAGDALIRRGADHARANRSDKPPRHRLHPG
jgi:uncharacterized cupin superfamily protein